LSYYIGLLSGTSVDGIDAAIVSIQAGQIELVLTHQQAFSSQLRTDLQHIISSQSLTLQKLSEVDSLLAFEFSQAADILIQNSTLEKKDIKAIGSHGQTIFHQPKGNHANTLQIGSAHKIAANLGISVVSQFRNLDMAYGGQGAPLAPIIHQELFAQQDFNSAIINLGGIANISLVGKDYPQPIGFDTGPANCLLDEWISIHQQKDYDEKGQWAAQGQMQKELLAQMLADDYFQQSAPKSTGREYFNYRWYENFKEQFKTCSAVDIQATLAHLVAASIAQAIYQQDHQIDEVIVMGGGAKNTFVKRLIEEYSQIKTKTSTEMGRDGDWIEAMLFAYLAYKRVNNEKISLQSITGSSTALYVGDVVRVG